MTLCLEFAYRNGICMSEQLNSFCNMLYSVSVQAQVIQLPTKIEQKVRLNAGDGGLLEVGSLG